MATGALGGGTWSDVLLSVHSISSTLVDAESGASSGRSTPAMMNGHGVAGAAGAGPVGVGGAGGGTLAAVGGGKAAPSYTCCWDHCFLQTPSSPDLAEHIRATHVDGLRGGVSCLSVSLWSVSFSLFVCRSLAGWLFLESSLCIHLCELVCLYTSLSMSLPLSVCAYDFIVCVCV